MGNIFSCQIMPFPNSIKRVEINFGYRFFDFCTVSFAVVFIIISF